MNAHIKQFFYVIHNEDDLFLPVSRERNDPLVWNKDGMFKLFPVAMILNAIDIARLSGSIDINIRLLWKDGIRMSDDVTKLLLNDEV
ncbi:MAG: hypothetical protein IMZ53_02960 [Thermoplasmata archaeon]|nr:hypothetical protein [Thermoplasmata archaeon]